MGFKSTRRGKATRAWLLGVWLLLAVTCFAIARMAWVQWGPEVTVNVRWAGDVIESERIRLEREFQLAAGEPTEGTTWSYTLLDRSRGNVRALVEHPAVDDTHGIDRAAFRAGELRDSELLLVALVAASLLLLAGTGLRAAWRRAGGIPGIGGRLATSIDVTRRCVGRFLGAGRQRFVAKFSPIRFVLVLLAVFVPAFLWLAPPQAEAGKVNVRWRAGTTEVEREAAERRHALTQETFLEGDTWGYVLARTDRAAVEGLLADPLVDDTAHIDPETFRVGEVRELRPALLAAVLVATAAAAALSSRREFGVGAQLATAAVVAGPLVFVAVAALLVLAALAGRDVVWTRSHQVTLSEAALTHDLVTVSRLLAGGEDPDAVYEVSVEIDGARALELTPLEAGVMSGDVAVIRLLLDAGARLDESERDDLTCAAIARQEGALVEFLRAVSGSEVRPEDCFDPDR